jgi:hypothetical protein
MLNPTHRTEQTDSRKGRGTEKCVDYCQYVNREIEIVERR